jgi:uncharacterized protein (DUF2147 family)
MSRILLALAALGLSSGLAMADPIEGTWKRPNGILVKISGCGTAFCVIAASGPHAGGSAGKMAPAGEGKYKGTLTELETGKTYNGKASIAGGTLSMAGCILCGLLCRSENWARQ